MAAESGARMTLWALLSASALLVPGAARAVPSFAEQTGQPCAACHVGAYGPQLTRFGRAFKLNAYTASDGKSHGLPLAATVQGSFTRTNSAQPAPPAPHFAANNNIAIDQTSFYYAGRIAPGAGGFIQLTYDGIDRQLHIDNTDIRYARDGSLFDQDLVYGFTYFLLQLSRQSAVWRNSRQHRWAASPSASMTMPLWACPTSTKRRRNSVA